MSLFNDSPRGGLRPDQAFDRLVFAIALALIFVALCFAVYGCTANATGDYDLSTIKPGTGRVYDTRACAGVWLCGPWVKIHPTNAWRDAGGHLTVIPEQANAGDGLDALSDPISQGVKMLTIPVK